MVSLKARRAKPIPVINLKYTVTELRDFYDPARDGVTQGILNAFKTCRELTKNILDGWGGKYPAFPLVYGSMAHYVLEQAYRPVLDAGKRTIPESKDVVRWLEQARQIWIAENPIRSDVTTSIFEESLTKNAAILPSYFRYWKTDFTQRHWFELERTFRIPWRIMTPTNRVYNTFIRGRIDGAFLDPKAKRRRTAPRLFETKNLSTINEDQLIDTLPFNLQTSLYLLALEAKTKQIPAEVEYNIIRKTLLRQGKNESDKQFAVRIAEDVKSRMDWYFVRMQMRVDKDDLSRMREEIDDLIGDFLMWWYGEVGHYRNDKACYQYNRPCDFIKKCATGDLLHLVRRERVFSELED